MMPTLSPSDPAGHAILRHSMVVEVATLSKGKRVFVTPLWFVVDGGVVYATTGPGTRAGRNVVQHPRVTLLFHGQRGDGSNAVLRVRGTATCHLGLPSWRVLLRVAAKYYVSPRALPLELRNARRWRLRRQFYRQVKGGFGHLRVVPESAELLAPP